MPAVKRMAFDGVWKRGWMRANHAGRSPFSASAIACERAVGAAVACPDRKVICMIGDGSSMYTIQALWTMARENLDICVMIFSNRNYKILYSQLADVGAANPGPRAIDMLTLDRPTLQFTDLAKGMGVPAAKAHDLEELTKQLTYAMSTKGPYLIDVVM